MSEKKSDWEGVPLSKADELTVEQIAAHFRSLAKSTEIRLELEDSTYRLEDGVWRLVRSDERVVKIT